jgi:predicted permease
MESLFQEIRYGGRMLIKNPGFTAVAILALALGIGANSAIFSIVNSVLLRPLPYKDPERLMVVWSSQGQPAGKKGDSAMPVTSGDFLDWRKENKVFEQMAALHSQSVNITGDNNPEQLGGVRVSPNLFSILGVEAKMGRTFTAEDEQISSRVVVIGHGLWQRRFGSDPNVIGKNITLNNENYTVIGVMGQDFQFPRKGYFFDGFQFPKRVDVYFPLAFTPNQVTNRGRSYMAVVARLKQGVSVENARAEMDTIAQRLAQEYPQTNTDRGIIPVPLQQQVVGKVEQALLVLLGAVGFVLLIACANVANLLLARSSSRQKEFAIRSALGASRMRVIRQLLIESLLLSLTGGTLGMLLSLWGVDLLLAISPGNLPRINEIGIDGRVVLFTLSISFLTGIVFGLAPALQVSRFCLSDTLKETSKGSSSSIRHNRFRNLLTVTEVTLAFVLLIGAGLMSRSFLRLVNLDPGFNPENVITIDISLSRTKYAEPQQRTAFFKQAVEKLKAIPGVESSGAVYPLPLSGGDEGAAFGIEGRPSPAPGQVQSAGPRWVSSDYFKAMGISLAKGRFFTERDDEQGPNVLIINESMARRYWPDEDPIGKRVAFDRRDNSPNWREIVGVVKDIKHSSLDVTTRPEMFFPFSQFPSPFMTLVIRSKTDKNALAAAVRDMIVTIDKDQPISNIWTMDQLMSNSISQRRFNMLLLSIFAVVALLMASVGIYGVISYSVTQRTHEIGIRMALGAQRKDILQMVMKQGMGLALLGIAAGLVASFGLTRIMSSLLFEVSATDPITFAGISLLLIVVALFACYIPARRAMSVDPMVALRYE